MSPPKKKDVHYVTSSKFKEEENEIFVDVCELDDGRPVKDAFEFHIHQNPITEILSVDLKVMVEAEVLEAYRILKIPCIVEHAGLIFEGYKDKSYPGGLTKPMWDTLDDKFLMETNSKDRKVKARAMIGFCDGKSIKVFEGETSGTLAKEPKGDRKFYWDTIFIPEDPKRGNNGMTYAEIVEDPAFGLSYKIKHLSQSSKAMLKFLNFYKKEEGSDFWP